MSNDPRDPSTVGVESFDLFRLQPNVPFSYAFSQLSVLLGCQKPGAAVRPIAGKPAPTGTSLRSSLVCHL
ncbi:hypothetical protein FCH83_26355 [Pseudomonas putida]|nr:hypothetical protein [Pseudomonas putida]NTZ04010.1 hypothetical protein [Pseudomonas putida]NTZ24670.1 hypothetical protein [Pseudomonas putida]NTZ58510.1 hypothetical protein [Pseudomonas putida]NTZ69274.1 hypothetical protein [Pseudomonas putida]